MGGADDLGTKTTASTGPEAVAEALYGADLGVGAQVGHYVVEEQRSRGGFATVYRGRHFRGGPDVALKVMHRLLVHSPSMIRRFQQEAEAIRRLDHPRIVQLLEYGELSDGRPFFVMEWLGGRTLEEELAARGAFSVAEALAVFEDLCGALAAAHSSGIVHRDIKPSNVIAEPDDGGFRVKLVDFGIAKLVGEQEGGRHDLTSTGTRIGTPHYMSPEQIAGRPIDQRADVYSLGVLLYQLLTGQPPFTAPTPVEIEGQHLYAPPPRAGDVAPVPAGVDAVIQRCLAKQPDDRYAGVAELLDELRRATAGEPVGAQHRDELRPGRQAARNAPALGLHFEARPAGAGGLDSVDDALLDALEAAVDAARDRCRAAGLTVAVDGPTAFLAAVEAPTDPPAARAARAGLVELALELAAAPIAPSVRLAIAVHAADAMLAAGEAGPRYLGGELLRLADWVVGAAAGVAATTAALAGVEEGFAVAALPDRADARLVFGRR